MNPNIEFSSEMTVKLIRSMASDDMVVQAAQVSGKGENNPGTVPPRLIQALLNGRHGSPFEHAVFTFFVEAPLFVFREWQRHRISSFNEMSGRYTELKPKFYVPDDNRKIYNIGTKMKPKFVDREQAEKHLNIPAWSMGGLGPTYKDMAEEAWAEYEAMLNATVANEVARMVLPLNIYSQMYWTVNARSLMNFISLRVESEDSLVRSYPQWEIDQAARQVELLFAEKMPHTHFAFVKNGRVAP